MCEFLKVSHSHITYSNFTCLPLSLSYSIGHLFFAHYSVVTVGMGGEGGGSRSSERSHTHTHTHGRGRRNKPDFGAMVCCCIHTHYKHTHPEEEPKREKIRILLSSSLFSICLHYYPSLIFEKNTSVLLSLSLLL